MIFLVCGYKSQDFASRHITNYIDILSEIISLEGHQNRCIGSKVTANLLNGWILPTGGASSGLVCACSVRTKLVSNTIYIVSQFIAESHKLNALIQMHFRYHYEDESVTTFNLLITLHWKTWFANAVFCYSFIHS